MQYVYLIKSKYAYTEVYKIGIANDPQSRLAQLQTGNPYQLEIVSCYGFDDAGVVEKSLHQAYKKTRLHGEWFELNDVQIEQFETICTLLNGQPAEFDDHASVEETEEAEDASLLYCAPKQRLPSTMRREKIISDEGIWFDDHGVPHGKTVDDLVAQINTEAK